MSTNDNADDGLTEDDIAECIEHNEERDPDDDGPDVVMLSMGYAELWLDGDVVVHGVCIGNIYGGE